MNSGIEMMTTKVHCGALFNKVNIEPKIFVDIEKSFVVSMGLIREKLITPQISIPTR